MTQAIQLYRALVSTAPDNAELRRNLGVALLLNGEIDGAADACRDCLALDPQSVGGWRSLGFALLRPAGMAAGRRRHFGKAPPSPMTPYVITGFGWHSSSSGCRKQPPHVSPCTPRFFGRNGAGADGHRTRPVSWRPSRCTSPRIFRSFFGSAVEAHPLPPHDDTVRSGRMAGNRLRKSADRPRLAAARFATGPRCRGRGSAPRRSGDAASGPRRPVCLREALPDTAPFPAHADIQGHSGGPRLSSPSGSPTLRTSPWSRLPNLASIWREAPTTAIF